MSLMFLFIWPPCLLIRAFCLFTFKVLLIDMDLLPLAGQLKLMWAWVMGPWWALCWEHPDRMGQVWAEWELGSDWSLCGPGAWDMLRQLGGLAQVPEPCSHLHNQGEGGT